MFRKRRTDNDEQTTEAGRDYHEVDAAYVILGADLLAREVPAVLQELMGLPTQRERNREIISVVIAREF